MRILVYIALVFSFFILLHKKKKNQKKKKRREVVCRCLIGSVLSRSRAWERGLTATPQGRSRWERGFESDTPRSLAFSSPDQEKSPQSEVSERGRKVAPDGSDVMGATPRSRSRFRRNGAQKKK